MEQRNDNTAHKRERGIGQILLNILKFVGFMLLALVPLQLILILISMQDRFSTIANSVLAIICFLLIIAIIMFLWNRYYKYSKEKAQKIGWRDIGFALLFFLITRVIAMGGTLLITLVYGEEMTANDEALMSIGDSNIFVLYFVLFTLSIGILVPLVEELTYRGIGMHLFFRKNSFWLPLIVTSSIFGLIHTPTNIISFLIYGLLGTVFFLSYYRRKNILDSMLVHIFNNILGAIFLLVSYIMGVM